MRDLVKIFVEDMMTNQFEPLENLIRHRLMEQISRKDFTILNITKVENKKEDCLDCYVDYEFWGGK